MNDFSTEERHVPLHFEPARLLVSLRAHGVCSAGASLKSLKPFSRGQSNPTFLVEFSSGRPCVLRKKPHGSLLASAHAGARPPTRRPHVPH